MMPSNCGAEEDSRLLDCKEIKPVHPEGDQSLRTDAKAETSILWPPDEKSWLIGKDPDAGKDWGQEEKGMTEDEMAGWHYWLNGHELELMMDREASRAAVHGVTKSRTQLSDWTELNWSVFWQFSFKSYQRVHTQYRETLRVLLIKKFIK